MQIKIKSMHATLEVVRERLGGTKMRKAEILIEQGAFGALKRVDIAMDVPVALVLPELVRKLRLPPTDLFGKPLPYRLRMSASGRIIQSQMTLEAAGVLPGMRLMLEAVVDEGEAVPAKTIADFAPATSVEPDRNSKAAPVATAELSKNHNAVPTVAASLSTEYPDDLRLYSSLTLSDAEQFAPVSLSQQTSAIHKSVMPRSRKRSRRSFLLVTGALLGVGVGFAAAYRTYFGTMAHQQATPSAMSQATQKAVVQPTKPATQTANTAKPSAQGLVTFQKHQGSVHCVEWASNGQFLASGADDKHVYIWDLNGTVRQDLVHPDAVSSLAMSTDGQRIVTAADRQVAFYQTANGKMLYRAQHSQMKQVTGVAWSHHGPMNVVSVSADKSALIWNPTNFQVIQAFREHQIAIEASSWNADGVTVATSSEGGVVHVWNAATAQDVHGFYQDAALPMRALAFAPAGNMLAVGGDDGIVRIWNALPCKLNGTQCKDVPQRFNITKAAIRAFAWSPDARYLAVGSDDGLVVVLKPASGTKPIFTANAQTNVRSLSWSPDGKKLAVAYGNLVSLWVMQGL